MMLYNVIQSLQYGSLKNGDKTDENHHPDKDLDFTISTRKHLEKAGVLTKDDLLMLTEMPLWGSRLLGCGKSCIWEIIHKMSEAGLADEGDLIRLSGLHFPEEETAAYTRARHLRPGSFAEHMTDMPEGKNKAQV